MRQTRILRGFLSHVLRNFIEDASDGDTSPSRNSFLSHVLRNFIEESNAGAWPSPTATFLSHVLRNFIEGFQMLVKSMNRISFPKHSVWELHWIIIHK